MRYMFERYAPKKKAHAFAEGRNVSVCTSAQRHAQSVLLAHDSDQLCPDCWRGITKLSTEGEGHD